MLALRNLLTNDKLQLGPDMVEAGLPKVVQQRISQVCCHLGHVGKLSERMIVVSLITRGNF